MVHAMRRYTTARATVVIGQQPQATPGAPTRCSGCRHASAERPRHCLHPQQPINSADLQPLALCTVVRGDLQQCQRDGLAYCGPTGFLFEAGRPGRA